MIESTLKVQVNPFSHAWTPPRDRQKERERKQEWGKLNILPRSNSPSKLAISEAILFCQQPTQIFHPYLHAKMLLNDCIQYVHYNIIRLQIITIIVRESDFSPAAVPCMQ